jgi:cysteine-rich repeat protein
VGCLSLGLAGAGLLLPACGGPFDAGCRETRSCAAAEAGAAGDAEAVAGAGGAAIDVAAAGAAGDAAVDVAVAGGAGGAAAAVEEVPVTLGDPCEAPGELKCAGAAQKLPLLCKEGEWTETEVCAADQNCDQTSGVCAPILLECADKIGGQRYCMADRVFECGPDLVSTSELEVCEGRCVQSEASATCAPVTCGDGKAQEGEECDDGNDVDGDDCTNACKNAVCGDGSLHEGKEACDDGNDADTDACVECKPASCGDGLVWQGHETCDDENQTDTDACTNACQKAACGDGVVQGGKEQCDDENTTPGDGCSATCKAEPVAVQVGENLACALSSNHQVSCWGNYGQHAPRLIDFGGGQVDEMVIGEGHVCVRFDDEKVKCAGSNGAGQLGLGDVVTRAVLPNLNGAVLPFVDLGSGRVASMLAVSHNHSCAVLSDKSLRCWGANDLGKLGASVQAGNLNTGDVGGEMGDALKPFALPAGRTVKSVAAAGNGTCVVLDTGAIRCLGGLGNGDLNFDDKALQVAGGGGHLCALFEGGSVKCWGSNRQGQLGIDFDENDITAEEARAVPAVALKGPAKSIVAAGYFTCAVLENGDAKCWGQNSKGQLGQGTKVDLGRKSGDVSLLPPIALGAGRKVQQLAVGGSQTCALLDDGSVKCWGSGATVSKDGFPLGDEPNEMGDSLPTIDLEF